MAERPVPQIYSIAAHRGFADALVAGLVPRYAEPGFGLARLTLLLPSSRAAHTMSEAFIRHYGREGQAGMLMPRMAVVGELDLDETLGPLLDPLGSPDIPPAADPTRRWLRLARLLQEEMGDDAPRGAALLTLARDTAATMDRLLVEDIDPRDLLGQSVLDLLGDLSNHWQDSLRLFARIQQRWLAELDERGELDAAARRNRLFDYAARKWKAEPPATPVVAAGVTSASPAIARLLRVVAELPQGAVILPDLDLAMSEEVWNELGLQRGEGGEPPVVLGKGDAVTHPQYHLKLLLHRMGVSRAEVAPWHRRGITAAAPERSRAISSLFLPPEASKSWVDLPADRRRLSGVRIMECANLEEEAQAIAMLVREAVEQPERRIALVTPDRGLARRVVHHLRRWNIAADDSAGQPLSHTPAGRLFLLLAQVAAEMSPPVPLMALLVHPLVHAGEGRAKWLEKARAFERKLRGPRPAPGLDPLDDIAQDAKVADWWAQARSILDPIVDGGSESLPLADLLDVLSQGGSALCGDALWEREDGRALSTFVEELRLHARDVGTVIDRADFHAVLQERINDQAVRPPYGGHPRVAIYGLLESRMSRADLVICGGLNEGTWPAAPAVDPLLAAPVLRAIGVPGSDFRIGLSAHDLAAAMGAPEVVLSRADRDLSGPAIPSRFLLRVKALLGDDLVDRHRENQALAIARAIDAADPAPAYSRPEPVPSAQQRLVRLSVTALDRLRSDPFQFYASSILRLPELEGLDAEPSPAWRGEAAHKILEEWHKTGRPMTEVAADELSKMNAHPLMRALWQPRLMRALEWVESEIAGQQGREPVLFEKKGEMVVRGVTISGKADRIDRMADGTLAIVDYKTGNPPTGREVENGFALQLGTLGLMAQDGAFGDVQGFAELFEYWSLVKRPRAEDAFGYVASPVREGRKTSGIPPEDFLPESRRFLDDALDGWILGDRPFTARLNPDARNYNTYDQLMRLDEWMGREA